MRLELKTRQNYHGHWKLDRFPECFCKMETMYGIIFNIYKNQMDIGDEDNTYFIFQAQN